MDLYGIGFSNIRMSNLSNDYTYKYDYRINVFPEEVYIHEFLHTLERISTENGYDVPELHGYKTYGYDEEKLVGLKKWYTDYMNSDILEKTTNTYVGLNEMVYKLKPAHNSNFEFAIVCSKTPCPLSSTTLILAPDFNKNLKTSILGF